MTPSGPLAGLRVIEVSSFVAAPLGGMTLAQLGADVLRIDNIKAARPSDDQTWAACQRGKRSLVLDLKSAKGETFMRADLSNPAQAKRITKGGTVPGGIIARARLT